MNIQKADGTQYNLNVFDARPKININYDLITGSDKNVHSIDRGQTTDKYNCEFDFLDSPDNIREILLILNDLRIAKKEIILSSFGERFFGDNVNHTVPIKCVLKEISSQSMEAFGVMKITLLLVATDLIFYTTIPNVNDPKCLQNKWEATQEWNTLVNETYKSNNYFTDFEKDTFITTLEYVFSVDENAQWLAYWKSQRGYSFTITEDGWGGEYLFGKQAGTGPHKVIIQSITYDRFSPVMRRTKFNLIKVG